MASVGNVRRTFHPKRRDFTGGYSLATPYQGSLSDENNNPPAGWQNLDPHLEGLSFMS
jgi:hypothetical protein